MRNADIGRLVSDKLKTLGIEKSEKKPAIGGKFGQTLLGFSSWRRAPFASSAVIVRAQALVSLTDGQTPRSCCGTLHAQIEEMHVEFAVASLCFRCFDFIGFFITRSERNLEIGMLQQTDIVEL